MFINKNIYSKNRYRCLMFLFFSDAIFRISTNIKRKKVKRNT